MIITYHGQHSLKFQLSDTVIAVNPVDVSFDKKASRYGATMMIASSTHPSVHGVESVTYSGKEPFVIDGPGSYEYNTVFVKGVGMTTEIEGEKFMNTSYIFELDSMKVLVLGFVSAPDKLTPDMREELGDVDIVVASLGVGMPPSQVYSVAKAFAPSIIIPVGAITDPIVGKVFLDESGASDVEPIDKLTLKQKDLIGKEASIVVLK